MLQKSLSDPGKGPKKAILRLILPAKLSAYLLTNSLFSCKILLEVRNKINKNPVVEYATLRHASQSLPCPHEIKWRAGCDHDTSIELFCGTAALSRQNPDGTREPWETFLLKGVITAAEVHVVW